MNSLFELIDKEIDMLINENVNRKCHTDRDDSPEFVMTLTLFCAFLLVKERVETLEEILISSGHGIQPDANKSNLQQQKFSVSSVKRDSMVAGLFLLPSICFCVNSLVHKLIRQLSSCVSLQLRSFRRRSSRRTN